MKRTAGFGLLSSLAIAFASDLFAATLPPTAQGAITIREFRPTTDQIATLTNLASFPNNPDLVDYSPRFEWPTGPDDATPPPGDSSKNNYGVQILGYFYPPETADYIFAINSDDNGRLYLSTDESPAHKQLIASEPMWSNVRQYSSTAQRTLVDVGTPDERYINVSKKIRLTNGVPVYIEAIMSEGSGGDNLSVAYSTSGTPPQSGDQPIPGIYLRSIDRADGPVALQTVPASQTIQAGGSVTFRVAVTNGTPPYAYQWLRDGVEIPGATSSTYSIPLVQAADNGARFVVQVSNSVGSTNTPPATLTVTADTVAPKIARVRSSDTFTSATVTFSEPMNDGAIAPGNYQSSGGLGITAAAFVVFDAANPDNVTNRTAVVLTTSQQAEGAAYDLTLNSNVKDVAGNSVSPNTAKLFANTFKSGILSHKIWLGQGTSISTLTNNPVAYDNPTISGIRNNAEQGLNNAQNEGVPSQNYLSVLQGFFIPAVTTNYVFFFCADNDGYMYLSTDENPVHKLLIAADVGWQNTRTWTGPGGDAVKRRGDLMGGGPFENRSDELLTSMRAINGTGQLNGLLPADGADPDPWPTVDANGNAVITLTAGKRYYMELWHVEFEGGAVQGTMKIAGTPDPANGTASTLTGNLIGALVDPTALPPVITNQPVGVDFNQGDTVSLRVGVDSALPTTYQWYRGQTPISGGTNSTLTIANAGVSDVGSYYVAVSNANGVANSQLVLVFTPVQPPRLTFQQDSTGLLVIEAEHYYDATRAPDGHVWFPQTDRGGYSGSGYMQALPDSGANQGAYPALLTVSPRLDFKAIFTRAGRNYVWVRGGDPLATGSGDSVHAGIDGDNPASARRIDGTPGFNIATGWNWVGNIQGDTRAFIVVPNAGEHTLNIWMREDGFNFDRVLVTSDDTYTPTNVGPPESASVGDGRPTISLSRNASGAPVITYTGTLESSSAVNGPYNTVPGASGGTFTPDLQQAVQQFYRAKR